MPAGAGGALSRGGGRDARRPPGRTPSRLDETGRPAAAGARRLSCRREGAPRPSWHLFRVRRPGQRRSRRWPRRLVEETVEFPPQLLVRSACSARRDVYYEVKGSERPGRRRTPERFPHPAAQAVPDDCAAGFPRHRHSEPRVATVARRHENQKKSPVQASPRFIDPAVLGAPAQTLPSRMSLGCGTRRRTGVRVGHRRGG